jgi:hypothetical protein
VELVLPNEELRKIVEAIKTHERVTGVKPTRVNVPAPAPIMLDGVQVRFWINHGGTTITTINDAEEKSKWGPGAVRFNVMTHYYEEGKINGK